MVGHGVGAGTGAGAAGTAGAMDAGATDGTVIEGTVEVITTVPTDTAFTVNVPESPSISTL